MFTTFPLISFIVSNRKYASLAKEKKRLAEENKKLRGNGSELYFLYFVFLYFSVSSFIFSNNKKYALLMGTT